MSPLSEELPNVVDWLPDGLIPTWEIVLATPFLASLVIAITFYLLAIVLRSVIFWGLGQLANMTESLLDDDVLQYLRKPAFTSVLYFGLTLATNMAPLPFGKQLIINILLSVIIGSWMRASILISTVLLDTLEQHDRFSLVEIRTKPLFDLTAKILTILVGSYLLLLIWGINPLGWLASAGIVGIAIGFAAQDTLANVFSGFFIVADAPYRIGDYITLDTGERGLVSRIGLRSTRLLTRDDVEITIPNGVIASAKIVNESGGPYLKIRVPIAFGVAYGSDVDHVSEVVQTIAESHPSVCEQPQPMVRMRAFGASSLDFELLVWIEDPQYKGSISHDLFVEIYKAFGREDIEIPYSKQDLYLKELPQKE
ncbi:MAG TPA: mechanosensitive ion channel family protein [Gammaproteobacteria bacterium]|nr:mechanosensitive ion channel family protein [Gammaproteobacteria bacterium]HCP49371.1 mechanosensitive ion channel family protein [Gammaproteobacteria bacterium]